MDLNKPTTNRVVAPKIRTYEATGDYLRSKTFTKKFPKFTEGNDVIGGKVNLSMAMRDLHHAETRLKAKKHYEQEKRKELDGKWAELQQKELQFRETILQFNEFIKENEQKKDRGLEQSEYYREQVAERTQRNNELFHEYWELKNAKKLMDEKIKEYEIYENFLCDLVNAYPHEFKTVLDVIMRYETLMDAKAFLATKQQSDINVLAVEKDKLRHLTNDFLDKIHTMHTKWAVLVQRYESAKTACLMWESTLEGIRNRTIEKILEVFEVRTTCNTLYEMICQDMGVEPEYKDNIEMQIFCIRKTLRDLDGVNKTVREMQKKEQRASERTLISGSSR